MPAVTFTVRDAGFNAALKRLYKASNENASDIVNRKSYRILQKAVWYSPKADAGGISRSLGEHKAMTLVKLKSGRWSRAKKNIRSFFDSDSGEGAPLLALIIQARVSKGKSSSSPWKGVPRAEGATRMLAAMQNVFGARIRSIGYFKHAFGSARDIFKRACKSSKLPPGRDAEVPSKNNRLSNVAVAAGKNSHASSKFSVSGTTHDHREALFRYGEPALQRAFNEEGADTWKRALELEYREMCRVAGIKTG
jgi:hypothetical protein